MSVTILENCCLLDARENTLREGVFVVVEDERIKEVGDARPPAVRGDVHRIDAAGLTVMPGLIDAHVHVTVGTLDIGQASLVPASLTAMRAAAIMDGMLNRGFTSVRDAGGADFGLARAQTEGLLRGPRLFYSGRALSQTGGHGDFRPLVHDGACLCGTLAADFSQVVDGVPAVQKAAREELRRGATQIKVMASGGVASPTDPVWNLQFTDDEIAAAVWEARAGGTYVMAHAYTPEAVSRVVRLGVRSIEHGNLIDPATARLMASEGTFYVPTLVTYEALRREGAALGFPPISVAKIADVRDAGAQAVQFAREAGVDIGFGTDLLGPLHPHQSTEFAIRAELVPSNEVILQATEVNARLLNREGELGIVAPGALADLLLVEGNPLEDLGVLEHPDRHLRLVMQGGEIVKNTML